MRLIPHTDEWYAWLAKKQQGYYYPAKSNLAPYHGEDVFRRMVFEHLKPEMDVFEVACAQGTLALDMAQCCRSVLGYDATPEYIALAVRAAEERGITNARFVVHNSRARYNGGFARVPAEDQSVDLWVNSKGPFHPFADAPRVCRPGAVLLTLVADGGVPPSPITPEWNALLPEALRWPELEGRMGENWVYQSVTRNLSEAGIRLHSWWDFNVPNVYAEPRELYVMLAWPFAEDEVPAWEEAAPAFEQIFREYAGPEGLELRWRRSIWKAVIA